MNDSYIKSKVFNNQSSIIFEKTHNWYQVTARAPSGELYDKVRCDSYAEACSYKKAFSSALKNL